MIYLNVYKPGWLFLISFSSLAYCFSHSLCNIFFLLSPQHSHIHKHTFTYKPTQLHKPTLKHTHNTYTYIHTNNTHTYTHTFDPKLKSPSTTHLHHHHHHHSFQRHGTSKMRCPGCENNAACCKPKPNPSENNKSGGWNITTPIEASGRRPFTPTSIPLPWAGALTQCKYTTSILLARGKKGAPPPTHPPIQPTHPAPIAFMSGFVIHGFILCAGNLMHM